MANRATLIMTKIVESYKGFEHMNSVVDVGGGHGVSLNIITSKYPHIKGINFDLPHVIQHASPYPGTFSSFQIWMFQKKKHYKLNSTNPLQYNKAVQL